MMQSLSSVSLPNGWNDAISTGFEAFDELLGNTGGVYGARRGKVILLSAQSGTGKTRLCLTIGKGMTENNPNLIYGHFTGEQNNVALAAMGKSMGIEFNDRMMADDDCYWPSLERKIIEHKLDVIVIDSFPMLSFPMNLETKKIPDTKQKLKQINKFASDNNVNIILLNHTDKKGNRGGRNEILHLCDVSYTLRSVPGGEAYDNIKVVEFHPEKNREGTPVGRAFPFNGVWDLSSPFELPGNNGNEAGQTNNGKVAQRKEWQKANLISNIIELGSTLDREYIDNDEFSVSGMVKSGIISMLRELTQKGELIAIRDENHSGRGQPPIIGWSIPEQQETKTQE
jgi:archaellum biogenesis ATPase FlaH